MLGKIKNILLHKNILKNYNNLVKTYKKIPISDEFGEYIKIQKQIIVNNIRDLGKLLDKIDIPEHEFVDFDIPGSGLKVIKVNLGLIGVSKYNYINYRDFQDTSNKTSRDAYNLSKIFKNGSRKQRKLLELSTKKFNKSSLIKIFDKEDLDNMSYYELELSNKLYHMEFFETNMIIKKKNIYISPFFLETYISDWYIDVLKSLNVINYNLIITTIV